MEYTRKAAPGGSGKSIDCKGGMIQYKSMENSLPYHQNRVFKLLSDGIPRSVADISIALRLSDPRGIIRDLRQKGIPVLDEWCDSKHGGRFKRYFIR